MYEKETWERDVKARFSEHSKEYHKMNQVETVLPKIDQRGADKSLSTTDELSWSK